MELFKRAFSVSYPSSRPSSTLYSTGLEGGHIVRPLTEVLSAFDSRW